MKTNYFDHNGQHVASIGKSGSSAIARAILLDIQPEYKITASTPEGEARAWNSAGWQTLIPRTDTPTNPIIAVREPIERFRSACAQSGIEDVDVALTEIESGGKLKGNYHFKATTDYLLEGANRLFSFPDHLPAIATLLGLSEIPAVNDSESNNPEKPTLTQAQADRVNLIYADDIALYASITEAGQELVTEPTPPEPEPLPTPSEQIKALWASLTDDEKAEVYTHAPNAILAWERDEMGVMIKLILANDKPEIATLKNAVKTILGI